MKTVYILTNEAMPGIIKIGWTDNSIEQRMKELDKTGTPLPFTCYYAKQVDDPNFVESKLHEAFDKFRIRDNREFFRMLPEHAKAALELTSGKDVPLKMMLSKQKVTELHYKEKESVTDLILQK